LIRINLLTEAKAAAARKKAPILPTGARLNNLLFAGGIAAGIVGCLLWGLTQIHTKHQLDDEIAKDRLEADRLKAVIEEVKGYEEKKASLEAKISLINNLKTNQKGPVRLMDEISKALPDLVWLTALDLAGDQITMRGKTLSPNAVATYLENLKKSPFFAEPVFRNLGKDAGGLGTYSWEMTLTFKPGAALASGSTAPAPPGPSGPGKTEKGT
jgi:type IV pilus assembly protein PilN